MSSFTNKNIKMGRIQCIWEHSLKFYQKVWATPRSQKDWHLNISKIKHLWNFYISIDTMDGNICEYSKYLNIIFNIYESYLTSQCCTHSVKPIFQSPFQWSVKWNIVIVKICIAKTLLFKIFQMFLQFIYRIAFSLRKTLNHILTGNWP